MFARHPTKPGRRREFLRGVVRYTALSGLAGVFALLVQNGRRPGNAGECVRQFACGHCSRAVRCQLPPAVEFRRKTPEAT